MTGILYVDHIALGSVHKSIRATSTFNSGKNTYPASAAPSILQRRSKILSIHAVLIPPSPPNSGVPILVLYTGEATRNIHCPREVFCSPREQHETFPMRNGSEISAVGFRGLRGSS